MKNDLKFDKKIEELSGLCNNWDGYGAVPIRKDCLKHLTSLHDLIGVWDFSMWQISPSPNGHVFLNYKGHNCMAGIVILPSTYVWFIEKDTLEGSELQFSAELVKKLMDSIVQS